MSNTNTQVKRGRGRPKSFPNQPTKTFGCNIPVATIELIERASAKREINQNIVVDRAIRAYLRNL